MDEKTKYIIPRNYDFKPKLFGIIEYKFGIFVSALTLLLIIILQNFKMVALMKIQIIIVIIVPIVMIGTVGVRGEKLFDIIKLLFSYSLKPKVYFYFKEGSSLASDD